MSTSQITTRHQTIIRTANHMVSLSTQKQQDFTPEPYPETSDTCVLGISGNNLVGGYSDDSHNWHAFLYDGTSWITLDKPGATQASAYGVDGSNIVGYYVDNSNPRGFLYDGLTWTTLDMPGVNWTEILGIDGNNIVGRYVDASYNWHGILYTIPEPTTLLLLGLGAIALRRKDSTFLKERISNGCI